MNIFSIILTLFLAVGFIFSIFIIPKIFKSKNIIRRVIMWLFVLLIFLGAVGFFGSAISSLGGLNWLPDSFEWPIGYVDGVIKINEKYFVVPHTPTGRIQVYDTNLNFLRGWNVDARGGLFKLKKISNNSFAVYSIRRNHRYVFNINGKLIASEPYDLDQYDKIPKSNKSILIYTSPWLLIFTSPFYSVFLLFFGIVGMIILDKFSKKKKRTTVSKNKF